MTKFNLKILKQEQYFKGGKFETLETKDRGNEHTWENIEKATCQDTLKYFRKVFNSKQKVTTEKKNGMEIIKIFSYEPHSTTKRTVHIFTEIKESEK